MSYPVFPIRRPSLFWLATEAGRAVTELGITYSYQKLYKSEPSGDGHPVLVLPGFMAGKNSTVLLRSYLDNLGYVAYDWGLGRNRGKVAYMDCLVETADILYRKHRRQVSLVGWSLGGVFARQIAKERPEIIRQVITLGSPFRGITQPNNIAWLHTLVSGGKRVEDVASELLDNLPLPPPVPTTAVYSKEDGIVPWQMCMEADENEWRQNIQVRGSHCGLGVNYSVLSIIADRLQYNRENWRHFKPKGMVEGMLLYPSL